MGTNVPEKNPKNSTIKYGGQKGILWGQAELYSQASDSKSEKFLTTLCLLQCHPMLRHLVQIIFANLHPRYATELSIYPTTETRFSEVNPLVKNILSKYPCFFGKVRNSCVNLGILMPLGKIIILSKLLEYLLH